MLIVCMGNESRMKKNSVKHYSRSPKSPAGGADITQQDAAQPAAEGLETQDEEGGADTGAPVAGDFLPLELEVNGADHGERLDKLLARHFHEFSRSRIQQWIEDGAVTVDGAPARVRTAVQLGQRIEVRPQAAPETQAFTAEDVPLSVVHEDDALLVIDKPAGLVVHPAAGNWSGTVLNGLLYRYPAAAALPRAGIVHRLDKETTGLMVVARTLTAQTELVRQLQARTVKRTYIALVWGETPEEGTIDAPIGRDPRERIRMAIVRTSSGKPSRTHFRTVGVARLGRATVSMVLCQLETGRTHQIRVHFESIGHPLLADPVYHRATQRGMRQAVKAPLPVPLERQALHAYKLGLIHPVSGKAVSWQAPPPADLQALIDALEFTAPGDEEEEGDEGGEGEYGYEDGGEYGDDEDWDDDEA